MIFGPPPRGKPNMQTRVMRRFKRWPDRPRLGSRICLSCVDGCGLRIPAEVVFVPEQVLYAVIAGLSADDAVDFNFHFLNRFIRSVSVHYHWLFALLVGLLYGLD